MEPAPILPPRDPEFHRPAEPRLIEVDYPPEYYLRLVANPFLGLFGLLVWLGVVGWLYSRAEIRGGPLAPIVALVSVMYLALVPRLFQYHCLDCGRTDRLSRWREHTCPNSVARRAAGRPRRLRGPSPPLQVVLWLWILLLLSIWLVSWGVPSPL
ncbi:MAG: hypothetical protein IRY99_07660 [Isosphaeraceae bacterium]|nr:hypothetical protein [Isosphaeraceae bacterium]